MAAPGDRRFSARLQRVLKDCVETFMKDETGFEPYMAMSIINDDDTDTFPANFSFSLRYPDVPLGVKLNVTVVDNGE